MLLSGKQSDLFIWFQIQEEMKFYQLQSSKSVFIQARLIKTKKLIITDL